MREAIELTKRTTAKQGRLVGSVSFGFRRFRKEVVDPAAEAGEDVFAGQFVVLREAGSSFRPRDKPAPCVSRGGRPRRA